MPEVSVIVPAYNNADQISRALASVIDQSLTDLEIIVIDDCSGDATVQVVRDIMRAEPRVKLIEQPTNLGPSAARNRGLAAAQARWIALLDADDAYHPERLEKLVCLGNMSKADVVADNLAICREPTGEPVGCMFDSHKPLPSHFSAATFIMGNIPDSAGKRTEFGFLKPVIRREFLVRHGIRYNEEMRFAEDYAFGLSVLMAGAKWINFPISTYYYTVRSSSLTAQHGFKDLELLRDSDFRALATPTARNSPSLQIALRHHLRSTQERYHWRIFSDAIKRRKFLTALRVLCTSFWSLDVILRRLVIRVINLNSVPKSGSRH